MSRKYVDESEVPLRFGKSLEWPIIFDSVPKGKALVLTDVLPVTVRKALERQQKHNRFKGMYVVQRGKTVYIVNPKETNQE